MSDPKPQPHPESTVEIEATDAVVRRRTRRAFLGLGAGAVAGFAGWSWLRSRSADGGIPWPLRQSHLANERLGRALYSKGKAAPEFSPALAADPRVNGQHGWPTVPTETIAVESSADFAAKMTVAQLFADLPRVDSTTELKCIEGWAQVVTWSGIRFADAAAKHGWPVDKFPYGSIMTADEAYYVGLDVESLLHPQTLLCDRMNGAPLTAGHGAPLRLVIPVKYGIKNIKWIARIRFQTERPADYWAERGYDWYSGL